MNQRTMQMHALAHQHSQSPQEKTKLQCKHKTSTGKSGTSAYDEQMVTAPTQIPAKQQFLIEKVLYSSECLILF